MSFFDDLSPLGKILCGAALVAAAPVAAAAATGAAATRAAPHRIFPSGERSSKKDMVSLLRYWVDGRKNRGRSVSPPCGYRCSRRGSARTDP